MSERAPHYCPGCGLDYWRLAAGTVATAARPLPAPAPIDRRLNVALVTAGLAGLIAAGIGTTVMVLGGIEPERPVVANTLPSRGPEEYLIQRFFREARNPHAGFSFVSEGMLRQIDPAGTDVALSQSVVMRGDDWIGHGTVSTDGETVEVSVAEVGGEYFEREGTDSEWVRAATPDDGPASPFARISTVGEIEYVGSETADGATLHHLLVTKWLGGSGRDFRLAGFDRVTDRESRFDIWVTDDGVPIRGHSVTTFSVREGGESYTFAADMTLTFDDWGDVEPIEPPA